MVRISGMQQVSSVLKQTTLLATGFTGRGQKAMELLRNVVLDRILMRRTKVQQADVLALPPR